MNPTDVFMRIVSVNYPTEEEDEYLAVGEDRRP